MEEETSIAKVRNKLSPIVSYFAMREMIDKNELNKEHEAAFLKLIDNEYDLIQNVVMEQLLILIKDDSIW